VPPESHLSHEHIGSFLAGQLTAEQSADFEAHLDLCEVCRQVVSEVARNSLGLTVSSLAMTDVVPSGQVLPVAVGDGIDGRYRVERLLGVGGMGCVYEALQTHLNTKVALKFMLPHLVSDTSAVGRFLREARAVARLRTPHVCHVFDLGTIENGTPFLAMEFLEGETVEARLERTGPFTEAVVRQIAIDTLEAIVEAHALGVVHRDLKPSNLFFTTQPGGAETLKVLDFGIAKSVHPDIELGLVATSTRMLVGSPNFMAPEQFEPGPVDERVDIWALGCVMYQLLTGRQPFVGDSLVDLMFSIQKRPHDELRGTLGAVVNRCLEKKPSARYASAAELRAALVAVKPSASIPETIEEDAPWLRRRQWRFTPKWAVAAGVAVCLLVGSLIASRNDIAPPQTAVVEARPPEPVEVPTTAVPTTAVPTTAVPTTAVAPPPPAGQPPPTEVAPRPIITKPLKTLRTSPARPVTPTHSAKPGGGDFDDLLIERR